jgi:hypothetical protein
VVFDLPALFAVLAAGDFVLVGELFAEPFFVFDAAATGFLAATIFFASFVSLGAAFWADFALLIPSTDFLGVEPGFSMILEAPLGAGLAAAFSDLPDFLLPGAALDARLATLVWGLEGAVLELADFLRSVDKVAAPQRGQ